MHAIIIDELLRFIEPIDGPRRVPVPRSHACITNTWARVLRDTHRRLHHAAIRDLANVADADYANVFRQYLSPRRTSHRDIIVEARRHLADVFTRDELPKTWLCSDPLRYAVCMCDYEQRFLLHERYLRYAHERQEQLFAYARALELISFSSRDEREQQQTEVRDDDDEREEEEATLHTRSFIGQTDLRELRARATRTTRRERLTDLWRLANGAHDWLTVLSCHRPEDFDRAIPEDMSALEGFFVDIVHVYAMNVYLHLRALSASTTWRFDGRANVGTTMRFGLAYRAVGLFSRVSDIRPFNEMAHILANYHATEVDSLVLRNIEHVRSFASLCTVDDNTERPHLTLTADERARYQRVLEAAGGCGEVEKDGDDAKPIDDLCVREPIRPSSNILYSYHLLSMPDFVSRTLRRLWLHLSVESFERVVTFAWCCLPPFDATLWCDTRNNLCLCRRALESRLCLIERDVEAVEPYLHRRSNARVDVRAILTRYADRHRYHTTPSVERDRLRATALPGEQQHELVILRGAISQQSDTIAKTNEQYLNSVCARNCVPSESVHALYAVQDYGDWNAVWMTVILFDRIACEVQSFARMSFEQIECNLARWRKLFNVATHTLHARHVLLPLQFFVNKKQLSDAYVDECRWAIDSTDAQHPTCRWTVSRSLEWFIVDVLRGGGITRAHHNVPADRREDATTWTLLDATEHTVWQSLTALLHDASLLSSINMDRSYRGVWTIDREHYANTPPRRLTDLSAGAAFQLFGCAASMILRIESFRRNLVSLLFALRDWYIADILTLEQHGHDCWLNRTPELSRCYLDRPRCGVPFYADYSWRFPYDSYEEEERLNRAPVQP